MKEVAYTPSDSIVDQGRIYEVVSLAGTYVTMWYNAVGKLLAF